MHNKNNKGSFPIRNALYAVVILFILYLVYIYNGNRTKLSEIEMAAESFKRESEERVVDIQGLLQAKDKQHELCQHEEHELNNRIKSLNQQHSMLQSKFKETEADLMKLKQDMENMKSDHILVENQHAQEFQTLKQQKDQHAQEFQTLKQQKDIEISGMKDQVANLERQKSELEEAVRRINQQLQYVQVAAQKLKNDNNDLQHQQQQHKFVKPNDSPVFQKNEQLQPSVDLVKNMKITSMGDAHHDAGHENFLNNRLHAMGGLNNFRKDKKPNEEQLDQLNSGHQMVPPMSHSKIGVEEDGKEDKEGEGKEMKRLNPNDQQKQQILEPIINDDKNTGGGEVDGGAHMNVGRLEEDREGGARMEEELEGHQATFRPNPLKLDQIDKSWRDHVQENKGQQVPPLLSDLNDHKKADNGTRNGA